MRHWQKLRQMMQHDQLISAEHAENMQTGKCREV
jgi:hypothetical protein